MDWCLPFSGVSQCIGQVMTFKVPLFLSSLDIKSIHSKPHNVFDVVAV